MRVAWISLTPVKALALEHPDEVDLLAGGVRGDRRFYLVDAAGRLVNNKGRRGPLQLVHAGYDEGTNQLSLRFADGGVVTGTAERRDEIETSFYGRARPARLVPGPWDEALSELIDEPVRLVAAADPAPDRGRDGAATLLATSSLGALAGELGVERLDERRFRMNFGIEGPDAHAEDGWVGRRVQVGAAVVVPHGHVGRCAITTQDPDTGIADLDTLKALAAYRGELERTEPLPFGIHAAVVEPGRVRLGDSVALV
ncbi:MAG TPA: MOSC domain-containing protein [Gaiellaceae bacterium]|nr:MOSC domain-containing protein [Gaiellaceae bacterium]